MWARDGRLLAAARTEGASEGLFISAKRYALSGPDGNFIDRKESILGMLFPPFDGWIDAAWSAISEMWDCRSLRPRSWFALPAVRCFSLTTPAYSREMKALAGMRPWNSFLVAFVIGRKSDDPRPRTGVVVAPFECDPEQWAGLDWRFAESAKAVPFGRPDSEGVRWRLRTLKDLLLQYVQHPIAEMLAPDGSTCRGYTRGVLRRRPIRDGERWLILKEAAVWGDDPRHAFLVPEPEKVRADQSAGHANWKTQIKPALAIVGGAAVTRKMGLAERSARAWAAGERQPANSGEVARAIVAVANEAGLTLPVDEHHRAEDICRELPCRAAAVQCLIVIATTRLAGCYGGVRALARAMADKDGRNHEPTVRRWLSLDVSQPRSIGELNRIVARISKFSRTEMKKLHRRIRSESGSVGDRQTIIAHISLLYGAEKPLVPTPEETLVFPLVVVAAGVFVGLACRIAEQLGKREVFSAWAPSSMPEFLSPDRPGHRAQCG
jgi:hypothetical protein